MARRTNYPRPYGECQRCGLTYRLNQLKKEWTGLRVCYGSPPDRYCFDPRPPDTKPPKYKPEGLPRPDAAPETEIIEGRANRSDL